MSAGNGGVPVSASPGGVPDWLVRLAGLVPAMPVPEVMRPPARASRPSAVLVLFGHGSHGPDLLIVQRSPWLRRHAGQAAFPGGAIEPADDGPVGAALREAAEEAGVDPAGVEVLALLPELFIARSGFAVTPVLGWWRRPVPITPAEDGEVTSAARVSLSELADPANRLTVRHPSGRAGPAFRVQGMLVWGFTAALVDQLLALSGWERPWDRGREEDLPPEVLGQPASS